jgi:hypothetical protein
VAIDPVTVVRAVLDRRDDELDYAMAKLAFDQLIDPSVDTEAVLAELDRMTETARELAGPARNGQSTCLYGWRWRRIPPR